MRYFNCCFPHSYQPQLYCIALYCQGRMSRTSSNIKKLATVGANYLKDTNQYRDVPRRQRWQEMKSLWSVPRANQEYPHVFPQYPLQSSWNYSQQNIAVYTWQPRKPKALHISLHALNGHTGLSGRMAQVLAESGIVSTGFDFPNFGKSVQKQEERGHISNMEELVNISESFLMQATCRYPGIPVFVSGLSMGGLIAFQLALKRNDKIKGCIFINPAFKDNPVNNPFLKKVMMILKLMLPKFKTIKSMKSQGTKYSLEQYKKHDKLMYSEQIWTSTTWAILSNMHETCKRFHEFKSPYLCIQGGTDKVLNPFTVFDLEAKCRSSDKETVIIHDMWHAMWFDDHQDEVTDMIKKWILMRL